MKNIKVIFFDLDNTLLNHSGAEKKAIKSIYKTYFSHVSLPLFKAAWQKWTKINWKLYEEKKLTFGQQRTNRIIDTGKELGKIISEEEANTIFKTYLELYERYWAPFPFVVRTIKKLRKKGLQLGILTNGNKNQQIKKLKALNLYSFFDERLIVVSEEVKHSKPSQEIYTYAQALTNVGPNEILMVGDNLIQDIRGAKQLEWKTFLVDQFAKQPVRPFRQLSLLF